MREIRSHWHAECTSCRQLVSVAATNGDKPIPPVTARYALCPYCLHAESYDPAVLILHSGYGTLYYPPERNLTDTTLLIAGFIAAIRLARLPEAEARATSPNFSPRFRKHALSKDNRRKADVFPLIRAPSLCDRYGSPSPKFQLLSEALARCLAVVVLRAALKMVPHRAIALA